MKRFFYFVISVLLVVSLFTLTGCNKDNDEPTGDLSSTTSSTEGSDMETNNNNQSNYDTSKAGYQLEDPAPEDTIAVMHTSMGDITIRFFPEEAPKAVENFVTHAKKGYYDGLTFHRILNDFMIQGGDPQGTGMGGESIWGGSFEDEFSGNLLNLRGSLAMANSGPNTNGSQFFINQAGPDAFPGWEVFDAQAAAYKQQMYYDVSLVPDNVRELYTQYGGNCWLDGAFRTQNTGHTVFGQVIDGMDVVDTIAGVEVDQNGSPSEPVTITSIDVTTFGELK